MKPGQTRLAVGALALAVVAGGVYAYNKRGDDVSADISSNSRSVAKYRNLFQASINDNQETVTPGQTVTFNVEITAAGASLTAKTNKEWENYKVAMAKDIFGKTYSPGNIRVEAVLDLLSHQDATRMRLGHLVQNANNTDKATRISLSFPARIPDDAAGKKLTSNIRFLVTVTDPATKKVRSYLLGRASEEDVNTVTKPVSQKPEITSLDPEKGVVGTSLMIFGRNFSEEATNDVTFKQGDTVAATIENIAAEGSVSIPENQNRPTHAITVSVPAQLEPGKYTVGVSNEGGESTGNTTFEVAATAPTISSFNIDGQAVTQGQSGQKLTITGTAFKESNSVFFNDQRVATNIPATNGTQLEFTIPKLSTKTYKVSVRSEGVASKSVDFSIVDPSSLSLTSVNVNGEVVTTVQPGQLITLAGQNFGTTNTVRFGSRTVSSNLSAGNNGTTLTFRVPSSLSAGNYKVTVRSGGKTSNEITVQVKAN